MKAVVAAFNQEKALVGAFSVITNLRMQLFEALLEVDPYTQEHRQLLAWAMDRVNLTLQQGHHTALPTYNYTPATAKCVDM